MKRIISVIIALLPLCSSCTTVTRMNIYPVPEESAIHAGKIPGSRIVTAAGGGREATGLFYRGGDRLAVILHGSGGTVDSEAVCAKRFIEKGYSILIPEYPGYGASKKYTANESDIYDDCAALITDIQRREKLLPANTLIYGRSLGAAVAVVADGARVDQQWHTGIGDRGGQHLGPQPVAHIRHHSHFHRHHLRHAG